MFRPLPSVQIQAKANNHNATYYENAALKTEEELLKNWYFTSTENNRHTLSVLTDIKGLVDQSLSPTGVNAT